MTKMPSFIIMMLLCPLLLSALNIRAAEASPTIIIDPNGNVVPDTPSIQKLGNVYTFTGNISDSVEVQRSNIIIDGNGYTLSGSGSESGIYLSGFLYEVNNVTVRNLRITNFSKGIDLDTSSYNVIRDNTLYNTMQGIFIGASSFNNLSQNTVTNPIPNLWPSTTGIFVSGGSYNNTVSYNRITNTNFGVHLFFSSLTAIARNNITNNFNGVYLSYASNNTVYENRITNNPTAGIYFYQASSNNTVLGNTIMNNNRGIHMDPPANNNTIEGNTIALNSNGLYIINSTDNSFHENNFVNNTRHVYLESPGFANSFNSSYPIGGNFWSNYTGVDIFKGSFQSLTGSDGLGDSAHILDLDNADHYPLVGKFSSFEALPRYRVKTISNSTIDSFTYFDHNGTIKMHVTNSSTAQSLGFMRLTIPKELIGTPYTVAIDAGGTPVLNLNDTLHDTAVDRWIYFAYPHSTHEITVQGVPPDITTPAISILSPEDKAYNTRDIALTFTLSEPTSWIRYSLDSQSNVTTTGNTTLTGLLDGPHTVIVYANDTSGNVGNSATVHFSIDATPPAIQILSPENRTYEARGLPLTFTLSEQASWIGYSLDSKANATISGNTTITNLSNGTHTIEIYANDTLGNMGRSNRVYWTVQITSNDTTPPVIQIISPENRTYMTAESTVNVPLNFAVNEQVTWIAYSLDNAPNITISGNITLTGLPTGSHRVIVYALDEVGNVGASETRYFTVQQQQPTPGEPFPPTWLIIAVAAIIVIVALAGIVLYVRRRRR